MTLEYKGHTIEALASPSHNGDWGVEVTLTWIDGTIENTKKFGPYQAFFSQADAESWGVLSGMDWIDIRKSAPLAAVTLPD